MVPHAPQFSGSESTFAHLSPHAWSGAAQLHALFEHTWGDAHFLRQAPQLLVSLRVSIQTVDTPEVSVGGTGQLTSGEVHIGAAPALDPPLPAPDLPALAPVVPPLPCDELPPVPSFSGGSSELPQLTTANKNPTAPKANQLRMRHLWSIPRSRATRSSLHDVPPMQEFAKSGIGPRSLRAASQTGIAAA